MFKWMDIKTLAFIAATIFAWGVSTATQTVKVNSLSEDILEIKRAYIQADTRSAAAQSEINNRLQSQLDDQSGVLLKIQVDIAGMRADIRAILAQLSNRQKQEEL